MRCPCLGDLLGGCLVSAHHSAQLAPIARFHSRSRLSRAERRSHLSRAEPLLAPLRALATARVSSRADHRSRLSRREHRSRPSRIKRPARAHRALSYRSRRSRVDYHSLLSDEFLEDGSGPTNGRRAEPASWYLFVFLRKVLVLQALPARFGHTPDHRPTGGADAHQSCDASLDTG